MTFKIDEKRFQELVALEEECNCNIGAGIDYGSHIGKYIATVLQTQSQLLNPDRLITFLQGELGEQLSTEDLNAIAAEMQEQVCRRIVQQQSA